MRHVLANGGGVRAVSALLLAQLDLVRVRVRVRARFMGYGFGVGLELGLSRASISWLANRRAEARPSGPCAPEISSVAATTLLTWYRVRVRVSGDFQSGGEHAAHLIVAGAWCACMVGACMACAEPSNST